MKREREREAPEFGIDDGIGRMVTHGVGANRMVHADGRHPDQTLQVGVASGAGLSTFRECGQVQGSAQCPEAFRFHQLECLFQHCNSNCLLISSDHDPDLNGIR